MISNKVRERSVYTVELLITLGCPLAIALYYTFLNTGISGFIRPDLPLWLVVIAGGVYMIRNIIAKIFHGSFGVDALAVIALATAVWLEEYVAGTLIVLMYMGGQWLESFAQGRASFALQALAKRMPLLAHRIRGQETEDVALDLVGKDDLVKVFPHEVFPVDGIVMEGYGMANESYLTGEPYPVAKGPGAEIYSGSLNGESVLVVQTTRVSSESRYTKIMHVMADAQQQRPHLRRLADQIGAWFTPVVLLFAFAVWYMTGDPVRFLAVLIVATPCPLLLAVPITIISAISLAARNGIIIKNPTILERLPTCKTAIFDKTGTLTYGKPVLTEILHDKEYEQNQILRMVAGMEQYSNHPLALAIKDVTKENDLAIPQPEKMSEVAGEGLAGIIQGQRIWITGRHKFKLRFPDQADLLPPTAIGLESVIVINDRYAALLRFADAPRKESGAFIRHLKPLHGFAKIMLLSGDREEEVAYLAKTLGIKEVFSSQTPEQKLAIVRSEAGKAPTLFMGDGINDAPAIAAATVGLAFGRNADVAGEAAGAVIVDNSLAKVDELLHISIAMRRIALQSALGGVLFSVLAMGFAAAGYISPVAGALLQEAIDVVAIANALRLALDAHIKADIKDV